MSETPIGDSILGPDDPQPAVEDPELTGVDNDPDAVDASHEDGNVEATDNAPEDESEDVPQDPDAVPLDDGDLDDGDGE